MLDTPRGVAHLWKKCYCWTRWTERVQFKVLAIPDAAPHNVGPALQCPHSHVITIWLLGNQFAFMTIAASHGHVITIFDLPSWLLASKINGEPCDLLNDHVVCFMPMVIHLTATTKRSQNRVGFA